MIKEIESCIKNGEIAIDQNAAAAKVKEQDAVVNDEVAEEIEEENDN